MQTQVSGLTKARQVAPACARTYCDRIALTTWMRVVSAEEVGTISASNPDRENDEVNEIPIVFFPDFLNLGLNQSVNLRNFQLAPFVLKLVKSQSPQIFTVGSSNYYVINVQRTNTETVNSTFSVEDKLPNGMTWKPTATLGKWNCTASIIVGSTTSDKVSCFYTENIPAGTATIEPIQVNVNVAPDISVDQVVNTAYLFIGDAIIATDQSSVTTPIRSADLELEKTQKPVSIPSKSTTITYTLVITNNGPTIAKNVIVTETLPAELNPFTVISSIPYSIINNGKTYQWFLGDMAKGITQTIVITTTPITDTSGQSVTNYARIRSDTHDWDTSNNSDSTSFVIGGLEIEKQVSVPDTSSVLAGRTFYYTLTITNTRTSGPIGAMVKDVLTSTLENTSCTLQYRLQLGNANVGAPSTCYVSSNLLNTYVTIPIDQKALLVIGVRGNDEIGSTPRTITNTASVTWGSPSYTLELNEVETVILPAGFIGVSKTDGLSTVGSGQAISYTITLSNAGSLALVSGSIRVTDTLEFNIKFVSINKNGHTMNELVQLDPVRSWVFPNKGLNPGESISFVIGAQVIADPVGPSTINRVNASANDIAGASSKSSDDDVNEITYSSNTLISIKKSVTPEQAKVGETFTFQLVLNNNGDSAANNIIVNDYFPDAVDLVSATTSRGTATLSTTTREVEVRIPTMNPDEKTTIVISARVNSSVTTAKTYRNRAYIKWTGVSEFNSNNVAFRVLPSGTLPGTGTVGREDLQSAAAAPFLAIGGLLILAALGLLAFSLVLRRNHPLRSGGYARAGFIVLGLAVVSFGAGAWQLLQQSPTMNELSMLSGQKPPVATSLPFLPASTNAPAAEIGESPAQPTAEPTKASGELLEVRPTPMDSQIEQPGPTPTLTSGETDISHLLPTPTPSTLPDFPVPTPPALASVGLDGGEPDNSSIKRLVIPLLGLDAIVKYVPFNGSTWLISGLKQEIAWMGDTSWPGLGSNTALAGHVDLVTGEKGPFWNLRVLKTGDEVQVYTEKKLYTYRVKEQTTVEDTDLTVIQPNEKPVVTLITCTGWDNELRVYLKRLVVQAELIQVKPLVQSSN